MRHCPKFNSVDTAGPDSQVLDLPVGWFMFSTYRMLADDMALDVILSPILDNVMIAKDYLGLRIYPNGTLMVLVI